MAEKTVEELAVENTELQKLQAENAQLQAIIKEQAEAISEKDVVIKAKSIRPTIKHEKASYELRFAKFTHYFKGKGIEVTEAKLKTDPALVADLIKKGSGALVKIG
jgi:uncharacterized protein (DUF3084 family)